MIFLNKEYLLSQSSKSVTAKRILFLTGTRADFGKIEPLAEILRDAGFSVGFFITGMHMMRRYGETRLEVRKFEGAEFFEFVNQREGDPQDLILSKTILGFSDFINEHRPDLVVIHGDRIEATAASLVCSLSYIRSAHIEGGEVSGTIDEILRHCNSKLCTYHFVSSNKAACLVEQLGESAERIFVIGSPELDKHASATGVDIEEVKKHYDIEFSEYGIVVFHPVTSELDTIGMQAASIFNALKRTKKKFVVISPNNDPGTEDIFSILETLDTNYFRIIPSMRFNYFSELMRNCKIMLGNSSAGVREAPFLGIPSIDIGTRQNNRASSSSVVWCDALETDDIQEKIECLWGKAGQKHEGFGDGSASGLFLEILMQEDFWKIDFQKAFASRFENE